MTACARDEDTAGDRWRLFVTALLVYALFLTPTLTNPMTWSMLDAAGALVETGRWQVQHGDLYGDMDVALSGSRKVAGPPPGLTIALVPMAALWRGLLGPVDTTERFGAFHVVATLVIGAGASALAAGEVAALAGWLGASRTGRLWAAMLFAFGTPAFLFGVRLFKENVAALAVIVAFRLAVTAATPSRRGLAGLLSGLAALVAYPAGLVGLGLAAISATHGRRALAAFVVGWVPPLAALGLYNAWLFGRPWRFAYDAYLNLPESAPSVGFTMPDPGVLLNSLIHQREGLLLYSPFLAMGALGLGAAWRAGRRLPAAVVAGLAVLLWGLSAAWLARFPSSFTGARYLFAVVPLLAAFAAPGLERARAAVRHTLGIVSVGLTYLTVQAGHIADPAPLVYALKTFVSGSGLPVLIKETLPAALGLETLHTTLGRAEVTSRDLVAMLATPVGWQLALNQTLVIVLGAVVFTMVAAVVHRLWARATVARAVAPPALAR